MTPDDTKAILFKTGNIGDEFFTFNRACENRADFREEVERMWVQYKPYCPDPHFETEFRNNCLARLWEIHLGCTLLDNGFKLAKPSARGPDFLVETPRFWVEAVTATSGTRGNEVREVVRQKSGAFPEEQIILRFTSAISAKLRKIKGYIKSDIIKPNEPVVIALNSSEIRSSFVTFDTDVPMIIKALFPLGEPVIQVPITGNTADLRMHYAIQPTRTNANGAAVPMDSFLSEDYACISAVLFCPVSVLNDQRPYGKNFRIVHNPLATVPLPLGTLSIGIEHWAARGEDGIMALQEPKDWRT